VDILETLQILFAHCRSVQAGVMAINLQGDACFGAMQIRPAKSGHAG
jgi:hypothetical protein